MVICDTCKKDGVETEAQAQLSLRATVPYGEEAVAVQVNLGIQVQGQHLCQKHFAEVAEAIDFAKLITSAKKGSPEQPNDQNARLR